MQTCVCTCQHKYKCNHKVQFPSPYNCTCLYSNLKYWYLQVLYLIVFLLVLVLFNFFVNVAIAGLLTLIYACVRLQRKVKSKNACNLYVGLTATWTAFKIKLHWMFNKQCSIVVRAGKHVTYNLIIVRMFGVSTERKLKTFKRRDYMCAMSFFFL